MQSTGPAEKILVKSEAEAAAVLFSGGRDSTLATLMCYLNGSFLHLLSFESGLGYGQDLRDRRIEELVQIFGESAFRYKTIRNYGLVRRICFDDLVADIKLDDYQLILLGESLAMVGQAIAYCRRNGLRLLISGAVQYQAFLPEQQPIALDFFRSLCLDYGITLDAPVYHYTSEEEVKEQLLDAGLSSKSLEAATLLSRVDKELPSAVVAGYLSRKRHVVDSFLKQFG